MQHPAPVHVQLRKKRLPIQSQAQCKVVAVHAVKVHHPNHRIIALDIVLDIILDLVTITNMTVIVADALIHVVLAPVMVDMVIAMIVAIDVVHHRAARCQAIHHLTVAIPITITDSATETSKTYPSRSICWWYVANCFLVVYLIVL